MFVMMRPVPFGAIGCFLARFFSLQHLIPHGRVAVRVLLAQLAFEVGQNPEPFLQTESLSDSSSDAADPGGQVEVPQQPRWNNMVHLAFIAANTVSDEVSTVTLGLFPEGKRARAGEGLSGDDLSFAGDREAIRASAASASTPFDLYSNPAGHASLALSARVLGMFGVLSGGSSSTLLDLCRARSVVSGQGPLMFPLLRLSVFLLVRLHPFTKPAQENLERLAPLVQCLLSDSWHSKEENYSGDSDNMCIVVLAHIHAALLRLKTLATTAGISHSLTFDIAVDETAACEFGRTLLGLLRFITFCRPDLLRSTLGDRIMSSLREATAFEPQDAFGKTDSVKDADEQHSDQVRRCWDNLVHSLKWMEGSFLFASQEDTSDGVAALLEACMPSLKVTENLDTSSRVICRYLHILFEQNKTTIRQESDINLGSRHTP